VPFGLDNKIINYPVKEFLRKWGKCGENSLNKKPEILNF
jgi:hypothetical protein